jgi:hypothetical protein
MKSIVLKTVNKNFKLLLDDDVYEYIQKNNIHLTVQGSKSNHPYVRYYVRENNKRKSVLLHRLIMGFPKDLVVDHIDRNTMNCQRSNLRAVKIRTNCCNIKTNTSGTPGIGFHKATGKWRAYYNEGKKHISLGYYKTKQEAIEARRVVGW